MLNPRLSFAFENLFIISAVSYSTKSWLNAACGMQLL